MKLGPFFTFFFLCARSVPQHTRFCWCPCLFRCYNSTNTKNILSEKSPDYLARISYSITFLFILSLLFTFLCILPCLHLDRLLPSLNIYVKSRIRTINNLSANCTACIDIRNSWASGLIFNAIGTCVSILKYTLSIQKVTDIQHAFEGTW